MKLRTLILALTAVTALTLQAQTKMVFHTDGGKRTIPITQIDSIAFNTLDTNGHEYVDLGLEVMWAPVNVDITTENKEAVAPEAAGSYVGWGDPTGLMTSTNDDDYLGQYPPSNICGSKNDIARVQWGGAWRLPTYDDFIAFPYGDCDYFWTSVNGRYGYKVVGPNGNSIFLPASGFYLDSYMPGLLDDNVDGGFWTGESFIASNGDPQARYFFILKDYFDVTFFTRAALQSVRPCIQAETMIRRTDGVTLFIPNRNIKKITFE